MEETTGLLGLPTELHDAIFELLDIKDRRSFVNVNTYTHMKYNGILHRDLGLMEIRSISDTNILLPDQSVTTSHVKTIAKEVQNVLIHHGSGSYLKTHEPLLGMILKIFGKTGNLQRNYIGFTHPSTLSERSFKDYLQLLNSTQLPNHTVLPRVEAAGTQFTYGFVLGLSVNETGASPTAVSDMTFGSKRVSSIQPRYIYFRPGSHRATAISVQRKHSQDMEEIVLFNKNRLHPLGSRTLDEFFNTIHCVSDNLKRNLGFSGFNSLKKIAFYGVEIKCLEKARLPASVQSLTIANNFLPEHPRTRHTFQETQLLQSFIQTKKDTNPLLIEFIHVQRVFWSAGFPETTGYGTLLELIRATHGMKYQCIQQKLDYHGELQDFATPSLEIASHRLGEQTYPDTAIHQFALKTPLMRKFGLEWEPIMEPIVHGALTNGFITRASSLADALAPMKHLDTLCIFWNSRGQPSILPKKVQRAIQKAVKHISMGLLKHDLRVSLIIVVIRGTWYQVSDWAKLSDLHMYRIEAPIQYGGTLGEIQVSSDVTLTEEERIDLIRLGADKIMTFKHYEKLRLGNLFMDEEEVADFSRVRLERRALEDDEKRERLQNAGKSKQEVRKRKFLEQRNELRKELKIRKRTLAKHKKQ